MSFSEAVPATVDRLRERFMTKFIVADDGCWVWQASRKPNGYGQIQAGGRGVGLLYAHRVSYELFRGSIPNGLVIDHLCRNRACVNPDHLEPVTFEENVMRGDKRAHNLRATSGFTTELSGVCDWYTPPSIFEMLGLVFDLDPCHPGRAVVSWVPALFVYTLPTDGLSKEWRGRVWLNPPYGKETPKWLAKMHEHRDGVALVFARCDTAWFHDYVAKSDGVLFLKKRVQFVDADGVQGKQPNCGSMLVAWGDDCVQALKAAAAAGHGVFTSF